MNERGMDNPAIANRDRMIRVDQAGEYGAERIYAGQLAVLGHSRAAPAIRRMADAERKHLDDFNRLMLARRVRPTALQPIWHVAGFALGAATALMGEKTAMACTEAVEDVIVDHYARQERALGEDDPELKSAIARARGEESAHHDEAVLAGSRAAPCYRPLTAAIRTGTRFAIWLSERV